MTKEHKIIVEKRYIKYELTVKHKLSVICGDSGSGKSFLDYLVYNCNIGTGSAKLYCDLGVKSVRTIEDLKFGISNGDSIFIFDEKIFRYMTEDDNGESIIEAIKGNPVYCIFLTRDKHLNCLNIDKDAYYELTKEKIDGKVVIKTKKLNRVYTDVKNLDE